MFNYVKINFIRQFSAVHNYGKYNSTETYKIYILYVYTRYDLLLLILRSIYEFGKDKDDRF